MKDLNEVAKSLFVVSYVQMLAQDQDEGIFGIFDIFKIVEIIKERSSEIDFDDVLEMYNNEYVEFEEDMIYANSLTELINEAESAENESLLDCLLQPLNLELQSLFRYLNNK
jgi:hypothetical protein